MLYERISELNDPSTMTYTVCEESQGLIYVFSTQSIMDVTGMLEKEVNEIATFERVDLKDMSFDIQAVTVDMLLDMIVVSLLEFMHDASRVPCIIHEMTFDLFCNAAVNVNSQRFRRIDTLCRMLVSEMLNILDFTNARNENIAGFKLIKRHVANTLTVRASLHHR